MFGRAPDIPLGGAAGSGTSPRKKRGLPRPEARDPGLFNLWFIYGKLR